MSSAPKEHKPIQVGGPDHLAFARHVFDNYQALIRSIDAKAGAVVALAIFLGASLFPVIKDAVSHVSRSGLFIRIISFSFAASGSGFVLCFLWLLRAISGVIKPRGARFYPAVKKTHDLLWQEHIAKHEDNRSYFEAISSATSNILLRNLTDQVFELAHISKEKMGALNRGFTALYWLFTFWLLNIPAGLILLGWKG
jgi:hypothetical protein